MIELHKTVFMGRSYDREHGIHQSTHIHRKPFFLMPCYVKDMPLCPAQATPCSVSVPTLFSSMRHLPQGPCQGQIDEAAKPTFRFRTASSSFLSCLVCELMLFSSLPPSLLSVFLQLPARLCPLPVTSLHSHPLLWHGTLSHLLYRNFPLSP